VTRETALNLPASSYEEVPYPHKPFSVTHPDGLAVVATLFGMKPAQVDRCRVLELGCAGGGNLIPLAVSFPNSQFVGIDLSPRQIAEGQAIIDALKLTNVSLQTLSIMDVGPSFGAFDYIISHGVYSWVPEEVQNKILAICKDHLAPHGVAYLSYNVYPGWHLWSILREMISFHADHFAGTETRLRAVRKFLDLLGRGFKDTQDLYGRLLGDEIAHLQQQDDAYLFHEHLEEVNEPTYFWQFAQKAHARGLQYLEEAHCLGLANIPPEIKNTLQKWPVNHIHREQYLDFLGGRSFRRTLLCPQEVALSRPPSPQAVMTMGLVGIARPGKEKPNVFSTEPLEFRTDVVYSTTNPLDKAGLLALWEMRPHVIPFAQLWQEVQKRLQGAPADVQALLEPGPSALAEVVLFWYLNLLVDLQIQDSPFVLEPGPRPLASPLARLQAKSSTEVTSLRHHTVEVNGLDRAILELLDGTRDRQKLVAELIGLAIQGVLNIEADGAPLRDEAKLRQIFEGALPPSLKRLGELGLLLA
jgi:methyltransferase-like protein